MGLRSKAHFQSVDASLCPTQAAWPVRCQLPLRTWPECTLLRALPICPENDPLPGTESSKARVSRAPWRNQLTAHILAFGGLWLEVYPPTAGPWAPLAINLARILGGEAEAPPAQPTGVHFSFVLL